MSAFASTADVAFSPKADLNSVSYFGRF